MHTAPGFSMVIRQLVIIIIIITSNDDPKPSTVILEQPPTGLIARHIKITARTTIS